MNITKQLRGDLRLDQDYRIINVDYSDYDICSNCGRMIKNVYIVKGLKDNKFYHTGSECHKNIHINNFDIEKQRKLKRELNMLRFLAKQKMKDELTLIQGEFVVCIYSKKINKWDTTFKYRISNDYYNKKLKEKYPIDIKEVE